MPPFTFVGTDAQEAEIGSVHDFDEDPHDSRWEPVGKQNPADKSAPDPKGDAK